MTNYCSCIIDNDSSKDFLFLLPMQQILCLIFEGYLFTANDNYKDCFLMVITANKISKDYIFKGIYS